MKRNQLVLTTVSAVFAFSLVIGCQQQKAIAASVEQTAKPPAERNQARSGNPQPAAVVADNRKLRIEERAAGNGKKSRENRKCPVSAIKKPYSWANRPLGYARGDGGRVFARGDGGRVFARGDGGRVFARGDRSSHLAWVSGFFCINSTAWHVKYPNVEMQNIARLSLSDFLK